MNFSKHEKGAFWVLRPDGNLLEKEIAVFKNAITAEFDAGHKRLALDLSLVKSACSLALGVLIKLWKQFSKENGVLLVLSPTPEMRRLFQETKLDKEIRIVETEEVLSSLPLSNPL